MEKSLANNWQLIKQSIVQDEMNELRAMFVNMARKSDDTGIEASPCSNNSSQKDAVDHVEPSG